MGSCGRGFSAPRGVKLIGGGRAEDKVPGGNTLRGFRLEAPTSANSNLRDGPPNLFMFHTDQGLPLSRS